MKKDLTDRWRERRSDLLQGVEAPLQDCDGELELGQPLRHRIVVGRFDPIFAVAGLPTDAKLTAAPPDHPGTKHSSLFAR